jgi:outer membrane protein insertion porin family
MSSRVRRYWGSRGKLQIEPRGKRGRRRAGNEFFRFPAVRTSLLLVLLLAAAHPLYSQNPSGKSRSEGPERVVIVRIEFYGNRRVRKETLKARVFTREGDIFNEEGLRRDFLALWNTQFFEDVKLVVEDAPMGPNGERRKVIVFELRERPLIRRIVYQGLHSVSESDILDRFKERKVGLTVESQLDPTRIKKAQNALKELLGEHGRQFAKVTPQYERIASSNAVLLIFKVEEGPRVKVGKLTFIGNHVFSDRKLLRAMRHDRPYAIPLYFTELNVLSKTYDRDKLNEDLEVGIRGLYQDNGYFRVLVKEPVVQNVDTVGRRLGVPLTGKSYGKAANITIPIEEGPRYAMGVLKIVSADPDKALSLKVDALKNIFPLKHGDILNVSKLRKALKDYTNLYGEYGFIDFTPEPEFDTDDANKIINLTLKFDEQKQYYVRRIDFSGNTTTRDKVIRRELLLDEGQLFNRRAWELSILRLNQLDYFERLEPEKAVEIKRNEREGTLDLNLKVHEKGKQSIGFQGGVSGLAGGFLGLTYQTNNFLGLGETLTFSAQTGSRQTSFMFGFTEPYLRDRPISTGFTVFRSKYRYDQQQELSILNNQQVSINPATAQNYSQNSLGATAFASFLPRRFSFTRIGVTYGYTVSDIRASSNAALILFETLQYRSIAGPSALKGIRSSKITPTIMYNTIDNPMNPTHGKSFYYGIGWEGAGGNARSVMQTFEAKYFRPMNNKRNVLGLRLQTAFTTGYAGTAVAPNSRFFTGGDDSIRGFDIRSISPIAFVPVSTARSVSFNVPNQWASNGQAGTQTVNVPLLTYTIVYPGGDTQVVGNLEYRIPLAGPVSMTLFADGGVNGILRRSQLKLDPTGLEQLRRQFPNATLSDSLELAPGSNFAPRTSTGVEFVVQLPIVQAPFRIYWAVNPTLYAHTVTAPQSTYQLPADYINSLPPLVYEQYIVPQMDDLLKDPQKVYFHERRSTFRFSVSRTF